MPPTEIWTMPGGRPWICTGAKVLPETSPSTPM
jgi:hypothetical protein